MSIYHIKLSMFYKQRFFQPIWNIQKYKKLNSLEIKISRTGLTYIEWSTWTKIGILDIVTIGWDSSLFAHANMKVSESIVS